MGKIPWLPKNVVLVFTVQKELDVNSDYLKEIDSFKVDLGSFDFLLICSF